MNLQQLYYFKALAKNEHLRQTSEELFISPPALSATISRLEEELGVPLFYKTGRNICLTEKGKYFYSRIEQILTELEFACSEVRKMDDTPTINVWTTTNVSWGNAFAEFIYTNPGVIFSHMFIDAKQLPMISADKHPDFVITPAFALPPDKYEYDILIENDPSVLVVYEGHPLIGRDSVDLAEVVDEPFITLPPSYSMREYIDKFYGLIGYKPNVVAEADAQLRTQLVRAKKGVTISTKWAMKSPLFDGLHAIPISSPSYPRTQVIAWLKGRQLSDTDKAFIKFIKSYITREEEKGF